MKHTELLNEEELKQWLQCETVAAVENRLRKHGIRYLRVDNGKKGVTIATTATAVNRALFAGNDDFSDIQFGDPNGTQARNEG